MTRFATTPTAIAAPYAYVRRPAVPLLRRLQQSATGLLLRLAAAERERRERRQMAELCDATLRDLGLSRADICGELDKPVWRR
jgi:uncharacterized protein YjiS (DUF1127 family)